MTTQCSIRKATPADLLEIERLLEDASRRGHTPRIPVRQVGKHHLLVVDAPDGQGLAAAALLVLQGTRGHVPMLVVDMRYHATGLEHRLYEVTSALCRAFGARMTEPSFAAHAA